jgi:hypothetical protein
MSLDKTKIKLLVGLMIIAALMAVLFGNKIMDGAFLH